MGQSVWKGWAAMGWPGVDEQTQIQTLIFLNLVLKLQIIELLLKPIIRENINWSMSALKFDSLWL